MIKKLETLVYPVCADKILLGYKKIGFGQGHWNGFGGKVEENEKFDEAAARELNEECGITAESLELFGIIEFEFIKHPGEILVTYVYKCRNFRGEIIESNEMKPQWFTVNEIKYETMWDDDKYWLPLFLKDKKFKGKFLFDLNNIVIEKTVIEVESLE